MKGDAVLSLSYFVRLDPYRVHKSPSSAHLTQAIVTPVGFLVRQVALLGAGTAYAVTVTSPSARSSHLSSVVTQVMKQLVTPPVGHCVLSLIHGDFFFP